MFWSRLDFLCVWANVGKAWDVTVKKMTKVALSVAGMFCSIFEPNNYPIMPSFDEYGYLLPYSIIDLTLPEFEAIFVDNLEDNIHRRALFADYLQFVEEVKMAFGVPFYQ